MLLLFLGGFYMFHFVVCDDNLIILQKLASTLENIFTKHNSYYNISMKRYRATKKKGKTYGQCAFIKVKIL